MSAERNFGSLRHLVDQARRRRAAWVLSVPAAFGVLANAAQLGPAILHARPTLPPSRQS